MGSETQQDIIEASSGRVDAVDRSRATRAAQERVQLGCDALASAIRQASESDRQDVAPGDPGAARPLQPQHVCDACSWLEAPVVQSARSLDLVTARDVEPGTETASLQGGRHEAEGWMNQPDADDSAAKVLFGAGQEDSEEMRGGGMWWYLDAESNVQGPFIDKEMRHRFQKSQLTLHTAVVRTEVPETGCFRPLGQLLLSAQATGNGAEPEYAVVDVDAAAHVELQGVRNCSNMSLPLWRIRTPGLLSQGEDVMLEEGRRGSSARLRHRRRRGRVEREVSLSWKGLKVIGHAVTGAPVTILDNVTGFAQPGRVLALMGPSGSGKSTLLDTLSGNLGPTAVLESGVVLLDGECNPGRLQRRSAYQHQNDALIGTLTVQEMIWFTGALVLPKTWTSAQRRGRCDEVMQSVGLTSVARSFVGTWHLRGLSGGQRRRLSIALALLRRPALLFMDEPTSGLDASTARGILLLLKEIAEVDGCNVVVAVHQPSSTCFALLDDLCLLSRGQVLYHGHRQGALELFDQAGWPCPAQINPAEHFLDCINDNMPLPRSCSHLSIGSSCAEAAAATAAGAPAGADGAPRCRSSGSFSALATEPSPPPPGGDSGRLPADAQAVVGDLLEAYQFRGFSNMVEEAITNSSGELHRQRGSCQEAGAAPDEQSPGRSGGLSGWRVRGACGGKAETEADAGLEAQHGVFGKAGILVCRNMAYMRRNLHLYIGRVLMYGLLGLIIGWVGSSHDRSWHGSLGLIYSLFLTVDLLCYLSLTAVIAFYEDDRVFDRELRRGDYSEASHVVAYMLVSVLYIAFMALAASVCSFFLLGFAAGGFWFFAFALFTALFCTESMLLCVSLLSPHYLVSICIGAVILGVYTVTAGVQTSFTNLPSAVIRYPLYYTNFIAWSWNALLKNQYEHTDGWGCPCGQIEGGCQALGLDATTCSVEGSLVLESQGIPGGSKWKDCAIVLALAFAYRFLNWLMLFLRHKHLCSPGGCFPFRPFRSLRLRRA